MPPSCLRVFVVIAGLTATGAAQTPDEALRKLRPAAGLKAELWAAEPRLANPVGFDIDARGRVFVAETHRLRNCVLDIRDYMAWLDDDLACRTVEDRIAMGKKWLKDQHDPKLTCGEERVKLIEDTDGDGKADRDVLYAGGFNGVLDGIGSDVLARGNDVWFTNIPSLWRLTDKDGDGKAEERTELHRGYGVRFGFTGHDLHGIRMGPDGKLYFTIGDRGLHVTAPDGKGISFPDGGAVVRCNPDGTEPELFATGLRNPQGLVFDDYGNLWTCDNTCDQGDQPRWTYVVEGADYGWRIGYQFLPADRDPWMTEKVWRADADVPYRVPAVGHIGHGPAGITCDPGVSALPERYRGSFLTSDFPGGIHSFRVKPKGAGYEMVDRCEFLMEIYPSDVEFGPDGAVYALDWTETWSMSGKGRIWRVFDPKRIQDPAVLEVKRILGEGMAGRTVAGLAALLSHADRRVRFEAHLELATRGPEALEAFSRVVSDAKAPRVARIHAIQGLGRMGRAMPAAMPPLEPLLPLVKDPDPEIRAQAARLLGDRRADLPGLIGLLKDGESRPRFHAANGLGKIGDPRAIPPLLDMLRANADADPWLRHAGVMGLAGIGDVESLVKAAKDEHRSVRLGALLALRRLGRAEIAMFLDDPDSAIVFEAARAIHDVPIAEGMPKLAELLSVWEGPPGPDRRATGRDREVPPTSKATLPPDAAMTRIINAAYRLGTPEQAASLAAYAARKDAPEPFRREALEALRLWERPSLPAEASAKAGGRDRVVGLWRPLPPRDPAPARDALKSVIAALLHDAPDGVRIEAAKAAAALGIVEAGPLLAEIAGTSGCGPPLRSQALQGLADLRDARLGDAVSAALTDADASVRGTAVRLLPSLPGTDVAGRLEAIAADDALPAPVRRSALGALGDLAGADADATLARLMDRLLSGAVPPPLRLDLLDAAGKRAAPDVKDRLARHEASLAKDDPLAPFRVALEGGDAGCGRRIFRERQDVQCLRCHKVGGEGGEVGPALDGIGGKRTREELLESIVIPNAKIAEGFGQVLVQTKDERTFSGRISRETDSELVLLTAEGKCETVAKAEIASRAEGKSAMPEDLAKKLSRRDLRDLVEFLSSLR